MSRKLEVELFNRESSLEYSEKGLGYSILGLRFLLAWIFIQAGLTKILGNFTAAGFLQGVPEANPFYALFQFFTAYVGIIDPLVMYGQLLIGIALLLGLAFRFTAAMGGLMMTLFWLASFEAGFMAGLPVEHGYLVTETLVYAVLLFGLGALGAGRLLGLDSKIEEHSVMEDNSWLKYLLG